MKKAHFLVEGRTEAFFVTQVLVPHFLKFSVAPNPIEIKTRQPYAGAASRGGIVAYSLIREQLKRLLGDSSAAWVTTMFDFYQLKKDFPGMDKLPRGSARDNVRFIEAEMQTNLNHQRFVPYLQLHEFEALLFSQPEQISAAFPKDKREKELVAIRKSFPTPEDINHDQPPSKRLKQLVPQFDKVNIGVQIAASIGLETMRRECPHFHQWLQKLETFSKETKDDR
ncbi:MAG: DUF4276 family protein [bacterium]|nr:DUF4276 family protein [bacterium]